MSTSMKLDDFLEQQSQGSDTGFTAVLEPIADKPKEIKVTPYHGDHGCGCASSFELPKAMIKSVTPTGHHHVCCGKRLEVVAIEFTENASIPVAELMKRGTRHDEHAHHGHAHGASPYGSPYASAYGQPYPAGGPGMPPNASAFARRGGAGLIGRWPIPWTPCHVSCIEVCTEFCSDTGWDCCGWETRCAISCNGIAIA